MCHPPADPVSLTLLTPRRACHHVPSQGVVVLSPHDRMVFHTGYTWNGSNDVYRACARMASCVVSRTPGWGEGRTQRAHIVKPGAASEPRVAHCSTPQPFATFSAMRFCDPPPQRDLKVLGCGASGPCMDHLNRSNILHGSLQSTLVLFVPSLVGNAPRHAPSHAIPLQSDVCWGILVTEHHGPECSAGFVE